jgi:glucokinase
MSNKFIISIDLGGTNLKVAVLNTDYKIKDSRFLNTKELRNKEELVAAIVEAIGAVKKRNKISNDTVLGVGIGVPGPVDEKKGIVHFFPNIPGWKEVNLKSILEKKLGLPVFLDNDAKLMTLAEHKLGNARDFRNALCLTLGTGVGAGLILNGALFRGSDNAAGEIGHLPINEIGPRCNCGGTACLEAYIGNNKILSQAKTKFRRDISLEELSSLAKKGNLKALEVWAEVAKRLGIALSSAVNLLNLEAVVIGGGVSNAGKVLFDKVKETLKYRAMSVQAKRVKIFRAKLGSEAGLIGAAVLVKQEMKCA